jgi:hypothetical protein
MMKIARFDGGRIGIVIDGTLRDVSTPPASTRRNGRRSDRCA